MPVLELEPNNKLDENVTFFAELLDPIHCMLTVSVL
jgi:hypothetical protein